MKSVMKRMTMAACGLSLAVAAGVFPIAAPAEATSTKQIGDPLLTFDVVQAPPHMLTPGVVSFFLGEDGGVWYTSTSPGGAFLGAVPVTAYAATGNGDNPFDQAAAVGAGAGCAVGTPAGCNGFVRGDSTGLGAACLATGDTCSGIYARVPGAGSFIDAPSTMNLVAGGMPSLCVASAQITMTGGDNQFWYTRFDTFSFGGAPPVGIDATCPGRDPFRTATEAVITPPSGAVGGTGFVAAGGATGLASSCGAVSRTCIGVWARFP